MYRFVFALILTGLISILASAQRAETVLFNGKVFTADPTMPRAEAIAVSGDRILAVGTSDEIRRLADGKTRMIDLKGRTVTPGFNDAHAHFMPQPDGVRLAFSGMEPGWAEVIGKTGEAVGKAPRGAWIFGQIGGTAMADPRATRFELDKVAPDHPVYLETYYGHGLVINSAAMKALGISATEADAAGGFFERDPRTKVINGRLFEYPQWVQNRKIGEMTTEAASLAQLKAMSDEAVALGVTTLQVMPTIGIAKFTDLLRKADLPVRVRAIPFSLTTAKGRDLSEFAFSAKTGRINARLTVGGMKWVLDGTPFERGAALRKPYADAPNALGKLNFTAAEIRRMLAESLRMNQPILLHAVGDATVDAVLTAMESFKSVDWPSKRVRIEHGEGMQPDLFARAKKLGVIVVQNPTHLALPEMLHARFSPKNNYSLVKSIIDAGIPFALGSDGPLSPYLNVMLASIHPSSPPEAITREQAVIAYTSVAAFAEFAEKEKGTLTKGKLADLTVLSQDIFAAPPDQMPATRSLLTMIGGKIVLEKPF